VFDGYFNPEALPSRAPRAVAAGTTDAELLSEFQMFNELVPVHPALPSFLHWRWGPTPNAN